MNLSIDGPLFVCCIEGTRVVPEDTEATTCAEKSKPNCWDIDEKAPKIRREGGRASKKMQLSGDVHLVEMWRLDGHYAYTPGFPNMTQP